MKRRQKKEDVLYVLHVRFQKAMCFYSKSYKKRHTYGTFDDRILKALKWQLNAEAVTLYFFDD